MAAEKLYLSGSYKQCHQLLSSGNYIIMCVNIVLIVALMVGIILFHTPDNFLELEKDRHSLQTLPFRDTLILMNNKLTCKLKV